MSHIHPPKALFIQIFMIVHQCHFISAIFLSKLFFKMTPFTVYHFEFLGYALSDVMLRSF
jgi:hypothetical protein